MERAKKGFIAAAAVALLLITAGCSQTPSSTGESSTIKVMLWGNNNDITSIKTAAAGFIKANKNVKVVFETGDCGVDYAACKTLAAGKNMPDVFVAGSWTYYQAANDGLTESLDSYLKKDGLPTSDFTPAVMRALKSPSTGKTYGLPMGYNVQSLFFNKDLFKKAGLADPPADGSYTYDDLRSWAKKLTLDKSGNNADSPSFDASNIVQHGYFNFSANTPAIEPGYGPVIAADGGGILNGSLRNKCIADSAGTIKGFQLLQDMMWKDHSTITPQLQQEESGSARWVRGEVAMQQGSHEQVTAVQTGNPSLKYDIAALPKGSAGNASLVQIHIWSMAHASKSKDAAWMFIKYMTTTGSGKQMGLIPAYKDKAQGADFAKAPNEPSNLVAAQLVPAGWKDTYVNVDPSAVWASVTSQDGVGPAIDDITNNRKTAKEALTGICKSTIDPLLSAAG